MRHQQWYGVHIEQDRNIFFALILLTTIKPLFLVIPPNFSFSAHLETALVTKGLVDTTPSNSGKGRMIINSNVSIPR